MKEVEVGDLPLRPRRDILFRSRARPKTSEVFWVSMRWTGRNSICCYKNRWQVLCEYDDAGTPRRWFAYGNYVDEVLIMSVNASPIYSYFKYYVHDHLYSPVALTNSAGCSRLREGPSAGRYVAVGTIVPPATMLSRPS